jgi:hypothetical protein
LDPYTFTHVLHGLALYGILWLLLRHVTDNAARCVLALGLESVWEVVENTSLVINKYRTETMALGYYGDSVLNSLGDIAFCGAGYLVAMVLPTLFSIAGFLVLEVILLWWIRDGFLLNVLMLLWPIESLRDWQTKATAIVGAPSFAPSGNPFWGVVRTSLGLGVRRNSRTRRPRKRECSSKAAVEWSNFNQPPDPLL